MFRKKHIKIALVIILLATVVAIPCAAMEENADGQQQADKAIITETPASDITKQQEDMAKEASEGTDSAPIENSSPMLNAADLIAIAIDIIMFLIVCILIVHLIKKVNSVAETVDSIRTSRETIKNQTAQIEAGFSDKKKSEIIDIVLQSEELEKYINEKLQQNSPTLKPVVTEPRETDDTDTDKEPSDYSTDTPSKTVNKKRKYAKLKEYGTSNSVKIQTIEAENEKEADLYLYETEEGFWADINKNRYPRISRRLYEKIRFKVLYDAEFPDNKDEDYEYDYNISEENFALCKNEENYDKDILAMSKKGTIEIIVK